ncbi:MAG TPA: hypothetical protein VIG62_12145 [Blastocatellia bacterium]|jgi:hypothetical protein
MANQASARTQKLFRNHFVDEFCASETLGRLCALDDHILERVANLDERLLVERHRANSQIIKLIRKRAQSSDEMAGFYILYPINRECEEFIESGVILRSRQITTDHICKDFKEAASLYLSMVYGKSRQAQGYLIYLLYRDMRRIIRANNKVKAIYVRPVTEAGFQVVERHAFKRFREGSGIYRRIVLPEDLA